MRVLLITDWMAGSGGAESYITWVRDGLRAAGDDVRLLTSTAGTAADGAAEYQAYGTDVLAAQAFLQCVNPFAVAEVRRALREFRPDVALVNMFEHHLSPAIFGPLQGVPTVLTLTDYKSICPVGTKLLPDGRICSDKAGAVCRRRSCVSLPHWLRDQPRYALIDFAIRRVHRVLTCSRWMQGVLRSNGVIAEHLPLPVAEPGKEFRRTPAGEPLFVFCGRLDVEKGLPLLLRAFSRVHAEFPGARLRIVGRGPQRMMLEELTAALVLKEAVTFRGWVPPTEVEQELEDAWALVAPSLWAEPLGLVAIEAIVRGVPVIASANGGLGETIEDGVSGLLFPNGLEDALVERLDAVARGRAFANHQVPATLVCHVRNKHRVACHIERLRSIFAEATGLVGAPLGISKTGFSR